MKSLYKTLKRFYGFVLIEKILYIFFLVITVSSSILSAIVPYFFKLFTDLIEERNYQTLIHTLILLIAVRVASLVTHSLAFWIGDNVIFRTVMEARKKIFKHVQDLDFAFHSEKSTGYLISAFKRGEGAMWSLYHVIHYRFLDISIGFMVMIYFFNQINSIISWVVIFSFFISLVVTRFLVGINIKMRRLHNEEDDKVSAIIVDNMVNFETVKLFSKEDFELRRLKKALVPWLYTAWRYVNTFRVIDISIGTLINICVFLILYISIGLSRTGQLGVGDFVLVLGFVSSFYPRLFDLVWGFREVGKNYADVERYFGLLNFKVKVKDPKSPKNLDKVAGEIDYDGVSFTYEGSKKQALRNVNLKIRQGQSVALVGRSGSGKTTLVKLLMRFYDLDSGRIRIDGVDISELSKSNLRSFIGVVPQEPVLFNNTIGYNICYGKEKVTKKEMVAAAKIANLHKFIVSLPKKYKTNVGERGIKLSGGQKQRLAIARMILSDPEIIVFDEATSQLDSENEKLIQSSLWKAAKNKTTIIIAHRLSTAMRADKIIVMERGEIVERGSHNEFLMKGDSLYKHFWDLQVNPD
jgi:ABC-type multidrug transport system fused ATPase/permease subunit